MRLSETITFPTRTPEGFDDLLNNVRGSHEVQITGGLQLPRTQSPGMPLIITSIGSRGLTSGREELYAEAFDQAGLAMLIVDSYSGRGFTETVSDQGKFSFAGSVADALFALDKMSDDKRFDRNKIALLGYSRGGMATVMSYDDRIQNAVVGDKVRFAAHVALYPPCYLQWRNPKPTQASMLMLMGGRDVQAPASTGEAYAKKLNIAGGKVDVIIYPDAVHSFDTNTPEIARDGINLGQAEIMAEDNGQMIETNSGIVADKGWAHFLKEVQKARGRNGNITGYGSLPRNIAVKPIVEFLKKAFNK
jgi:dienelactone hydrolase